MKLLRFEGVTHSRDAVRAARCRTAGTASRPRPTGGATRGRPWFALSAVLLLTFVVVPLSAQEGVIEYLEGRVTVAGDGGETDADFGTVLRRGDIVRTGASGTAVIRLNDRSQVKLRENTELRIDDMGEKAAVTLNTGGVFARVARASSGAASRLAGFEVRTPSVVAGVRGTEFFVAYGRTIEDQPDLWLCVNEGAVEVSIPSTGEATLVEEGLGVNILAGLRTTKPRPYAWTRDLNWNFDASAGEVTDDTNLDGAYADLLNQDYD